MSEAAERQITRALVDAVCNLRYDDLPDDAREAARHCVLDFFGVALAGAREPLVDFLVDVVARPENASAASLIGRSERAAAVTAALVNGAAGHALDFDDAHMGMSGHPTVPVLPAVLALAEQMHADGKALLTALVAGVELECRLALLLGPRHYEVGFHSTGTLGTFGAAAASAHLLGLDEPAWLHAMGLAGTQAAGLKSTFGSMGKPLHAGRAASTGLLSALLAQRGFTAAPNVVEVAQGFAATHAGATGDTTSLERVAGRFLIRDTLFKYHAACYLTHAPIEAARTIRARDRVSADRVESVEVTVAPALLGVCNIQEPATGLEGKFSLRATAALALLGRDTAELATYSDATMRDPALVRLRDRVRIVTDPALATTRAKVSVAASAGRFSADADTGTPAPDLSVQRARLREKFDGLAAPVLGASRAAELAEAALHVDELSAVARLLDLSRRSGG
ncbi:MAG: MmgE/PrpD family protein [Candidatus Binatia bacterium]